MRKCPICDSIDTYLFHDQVWNARDGEVMRCNNCDITYICPPFNESEYMKFYDNYMEHVKKRSDIPDLKAFHLESLREAKIRYNIIKNYFIDIEDILEIGSSTGAFMSFFKDMNYKCIEYNDSISDINGIFDMICMFHVFEHIINPLKILRECKCHLKEKGIIIVEVPNINDPLIKLYNCESFKDFYFQRMHPYVYSLESLDYVFDRIGFKRMNVIYHQRYGLDNHLTWLHEGKPRGNEYLNESLKETNIKYKRELEKNKITDTMFYIAKHK